MQWPVIHIVRRFGRVGGMESYVWYLVHGLVECGISVIVVCEHVCESPDRRIRIVEVESSPERPRWKSMMSFRERVDQKIREVFSGQYVVIHSHERSLRHQVTTFHGPPIEPSRGLNWLPRLNRRIVAWKQMEYEELFGSSVQMILPVSSKVGDELLGRYPDVLDQKKFSLAWPGVESAFICVQKNVRAGLGGLKFLFVGKEWKRKGLDIAVRIVDDFRQSYPGATLTVFGVAYDELPRSIASIEWIMVAGWSSDIPWNDFDILLHPARKEPFGMVVAEARARGLPVLMSSNVGAADLKFSNVSVLDLEASMGCWREEVLRLVLSDGNTSETIWTWKDLVAKHVQVIYPQLEPSIV